MTTTTTTERPFSPWKEITAKQLQDTKRNSATQRLHQRSTKIQDTINEGRNNSLSSCSGQEGQLYPLTHKSIRPSTLLSMKEVPPPTNKGLAGGIAGGSHKLNPKNVTPSDGRSTPIN
ncbi:hypothetical protein CHS0354_036932 [Potamilus streckersoni]|uniref:Uncharacterized protein n=1 Tax=Potamilus streckersoni TaxID=2493646 RepID=A0AAE0SQU8_9BIVA|nr:hypothetical protein CHS0354_036932 [Potamilus streckersoni]